jgi:hypothetical protein
MWTKGNIDGYDFWAKHYEEPSEGYGINDGRISKLSIRKDGKELYNFDRGLDFDRLDPDGKAVYEKILKKYN